MKERPRWSGSRPASSVSSCGQPRLMYGLGKSKVPAVDSVRDLGVVVDSGSMFAHLNSICKTASHSLWRIGKFRKLSDQTSTE